jgi:HD-GYP domain-containing protein (c-di-GMP phosphodiesterase class II)
MNDKQPTGPTAEARLNMLVEFGKQLSSETNLDKLLAMTAKQISNIIGAKHCFVFIKDEKRGELWSKIARGHGLKYAEVHLPIRGNSVAAIVGQTGTTINLSDAYEDSRYSKELDLLTGFKTISLLAMPLTNKGGKVIGVFQLNNKENGQPFDKNDEGLLNLLASLASGNIEIATLYEEIKLSNLETIYRLAITAEYRDQHDTKMHLMNISKSCFLLATALGFDDADAEIIKNASMLHDIGKVAIPDYILLKPGKLTPEEYNKMKTHTFYGGKILEGAKSKILKTAHKMSLFHHEKYDGSGYPFGLKGGKIAIEARILSVADVFDALCMNRVYKKAWKISDAYKYMTEHSGSDFDPDVIAAFKHTFHDIKTAYIKKSYF